MTVQYERQGHVRIVTIDRPEARNAIDQATNNLLLDAWTEFRDDEDAWVGILTGSGNKAFSAGADLKALDSTTRAKSNKHRLPLGVITRGFTTSKPLIAAINGAAYGGGLEMALACDVRVASVNARLALSETRWALLPGSGGTQRLPRLVPQALALEMLFTGDPITANRAYDIGLVNRVVGEGESLAMALQIADRTIRNGPLAVRAAKEAVIQGLDLDLASGLELERRLGTELFGTVDAREGPAAFREKRDPHYEGK